MDKSALGHDYQAPLQKHSSQKDYATGFGGKYGVQNDRKDESAVGWDHVEKVDKHDSQKGKESNCVVSYSACFSPLLFSKCLQNQYQVLT